MNITNTEIKILFSHNGRDIVIRVEGENVERYNKEYHSWDYLGNKTEVINFIKYQR